MTAASYTATLLSNATAHLATLSSLLPTTHADWLKDRQWTNAPIWLLAVLIVVGFVVISSAVTLLTAKGPFPSPVKLMHAKETVEVRWWDEEREKVTGRSLDSSVRARCGTLSRGVFYPTFWLWNGDLQTIYASIMGGMKHEIVEYERDLLEMPDGGILSLDWCPKKLPDDLDPNLDTPESRVPIVVIQHGLTGGSHESYVQELVRECIDNNFRAVVVNFRGCAETELRSAQLYSGAYTDDVRTAVRHIRRRQPRAPLIGVGFSLGANIMTKFVGEDGPKSELIAAVSVANPYDLLQGSHQLHSTWWGRNVYSYKMTQGLIGVYQRHQRVLDAHASGRFNPDEVARATSLTEFDDAVTRRAFGFRTVHEYYRMGSSAQFVPDIRIPMLLFTATDDPIASHKAIPRYEVKENPYVVLATTDAGGHIGWYQGIWPRRWFQKPVVEFIKMAFDAYESIPDELRPTLGNSITVRAAATDEAAPPPPHRPYYQTFMAGSTRFRRPVSTAASTSSSPGRMGSTLAEQGTPTVRGASVEGTKFVDEVRDGLEGEEDDSEENDDEREIMGTDEEDSEEKEVVVSPRGVRMRLSKKDGERTSVGERTEKGVEMATQVERETAERSVNTTSTTTTGRELARESDFKWDRSSAMARLLLYLSSQHGKADSIRRALQVTMGLVIGEASGRGNFLQFIPAAILFLATLALLSLSDARPVAVGAEPNNGVHDLGRRAKDVGSDRMHLMGEGLGADNAGRSANTMATFAEVTVMKGEALAVAASSAVGAGEDTDVSKGRSMKIGPPGGPNGSVLVWWTAIADLLISLAYFSIPLGMVALWTPLDFLASVVKVITAVVSCFTAVVLAFVIPPALHMPLCVILVLMFCAYLVSTIRDVKAFENEISERLTSEKLLRDENESMNLFRDITHKIRRTLDRADILLAVSTEISHRLRAERCLVFLPPNASVSVIPASTTNDSLLKCVCEGVNSDLLSRRGSNATATSDAADVSTYSAAAEALSALERRRARKSNTEDSDSDMEAPRSKDDAETDRLLNSDATAYHSPVPRASSASGSGISVAPAREPSFIGASLLRSHAVIRAALSSERPIVSTVGDLFDDAAVSAATLSPHLEGSSDRAVLITRVDLGDGNFGVMLLIMPLNSPPLPFGRHSLFGDIAEQTGIALQQAKMMEMERVRTEELAERNLTLQMVQKEIQVAREQKDFTAVMSHEMRTPLFAISALSSMILEMGVLEDKLGLQEVEEMLNVIKGSGDMLISIVNNILDFSKYDDDQFCLDRNPFVLREAVEGSAELVAMQDVDGKFPQIVLVVSHDIPLILVGDITRFRQIIVNLLSNACKFTGPEGDVVVNVMQVPHESDNDRIVKLCVTVVDSGIGISPNTAHKLFEKFSQADASITRKFGGTGLGLAIARQLCTLMKGEISARPNEGEPGTTFQFTVFLEKFIPQEWVGDGRSTPFPISYSLMNPKYDNLVIGVIEERLKSRKGLKEKLETCGKVRMVVFPDLQSFIHSKERLHGLIFDYRSMLLLNGQPLLHNVSHSQTLGRRTLLLLTAQFRRCPTMRVRKQEGDLSTHRGRPLKMAELCRWLDQLVDLGEPVLVREHLDVAKEVAVLSKSARMPAPAPAPPVSSPPSTTQSQPSVGEHTAGPTAGPTLSPKSAHVSPASVALPLAVPTPGPALAPAPAAAVDGAGNPDASKPTQSLEILIVEDNKINQMVIGKMLKKLGHRFDVAGDGLIGLQMVKTRWEAIKREGTTVVGSPDFSPPPVPAKMYDVVLMDIMMPNLDGRTATKEIRAVLGDAPGPWIVGLSANAFWEERMLCFECGMNDFIAKPASMEDIRSALTKFISHRVTL
ncbi:hypothetical protein HK101_009852 [Irineochytrium annulatum]|nr:hypothetical protein HK101_009852 [Irineochytrium annulatum]